jgi:hypothetical protein
LARRFGALRTLDLGRGPLALRTLGLRTLCLRTLHIRTFSVPLALRRLLSLHRPLVLRRPLALFGLTGAPTLILLALNLLA